MGVASEERRLICEAFEDLEKGVLARGLIVF